MTTSPATPSDPAAEAIRAVIRQYWGYDTLRPLQLEAMTAARAGRDALVVMPTGGGKSLCYQAPALLAEKPTVVVSPLIALMKDQVDGLLGKGIDAAFLNSSLTLEDKRRVAEGILNRQYRLIFVAPERFASGAFWNLLDSGGIGAFAIDEAHCISHWGHDFRGDYRKLDQLRARYPEATIQAFTATATPRVRQDIVEQLHLRKPEVLVGDFFRPNLRYAVEKRGRGFTDIVNAVAARSGEAGIVYCIRRADTEEVAALLAAAGVKAAAYHAGMADESRTRTQEAFAAGEVDVVVATVAFGMGIDRSDIRFVVHAGMPKSLEHYQQETGRAGRDGEPADCTLFYTGGDFMTWKRIIESNAATSGEGAGRGDGAESAGDGALVMLGEMYDYARGLACRHRKLVTYFGQPWERTTCGACDVCNDGVEPLADSTVLAQKIMSAVHRTGQRYGATYICEVLMGSETERVAARGHADLPTFGILWEEPKMHLMTWIDQLVDQGMLEREGEYRVLKITPAGRRVLRSEAEARLLPAGRRKGRKRKAGVAGGASGSGARQAGVLYARKKADGAAPGLPEGPLTPEQRELFEHLRGICREIADEMNVPAFIVFSDKTLRAIARARPESEDALRRVKGVGPAKCEAYGRHFLEAIRAYVE